MSKKISELTSAAELNNDDVFVVNQNDETKSVSKEVAFYDINEKVNNSFGVAEYDNTNTYDIGDYCVYNNILYKCTVEITTAESFNNEHWESVNILTYIDNLTEKVNNLQIYNLNEDVPVGIWITGEIIYRRIIPFTGGSTAEQDTSIKSNALDNFKQLIKLDGVYLSSGQNPTGWQINTYYNTTYYINIYYNTNQNTIRGNFGSSLLNGTGYIYIDYLKNIV